MELKEIITKLETIKKGAFTKVSYRTTKELKKLGVTLEKTTDTTIRFVEYGHIKGVEVKHKPNQNEQWLPNGLIYNENKNAYYLQMATTKNGHKTAKIVYKVNGVVVDKETYNQYDKPNPNKEPLVTFRKNINDIISLG